jgi:hypothetical protein
MKEVVWVIGTSASGKDTFIRNVSRNTDLVESLGWAGKSIAVCESSLEYIAQFEDDPVVEQREELLEESKSLVDTADIVLIKWQQLDTQASRPQRLKDLTPTARHRIIELRVERSELIERYRLKPWWHDIGKEESFIESELKFVSDAIGDLSSLEVTVLDSSTDGRYNLDNSERAGSTNE